ncbi:MAG: hypothetical protein OSB67_11295 [Alphaproteobacteria bacterium]|nr:hypothetical protein [Alphaproteobacteria bacterium]
MNIPVLIRLSFIGRPEEGIGAGVMFVQLLVHISPLRTGDFVPLGLHFSAANIVIASRPRLDRSEIRILSDQHEPVFAGDDSIGPVFEAVFGDPQLFGKRTFTNIDRDRLTRRLGGDGELRPGNFLDVGLQLPSGKMGGSWRIDRNDNFGACLAVFDQSQRVGKHQRTRERQHHCSNGECIKIGETIHRG